MIQITLIRQILLIILLSILLIILLTIQIVVMIIVIVIVLVIVIAGLRSLRERDQAAADAGAQEPAPCATATVNSNEIKR